MNLSMSSSGHLLNLSLDKISASNLSTNGSDLQIFVDCLSTSSYIRQIMSSQNLKIHPDMKTFGTKIRQRREEKNLLLRQVAAQMEMDTALLSKIERGDRNARRAQIEPLAAILELDPKELLTQWLADRVYQLIEDEDVGINALQEAETTYRKSQTTGKTS